MKKLIMFFLSFCLLVNLFFASMNVSAADNPCFEINAVKSGTNITVTVSLNGEVKNAGGVYLSVSYDETAFSYVAGSRKILTENISSANVSRDAASNGIVYFAADATSGFALKGEVVSYQFRVLTAEAGEQSFKLKVLEFYHLDDVLSDVKLSSKESTAVIQLTDTGVVRVTQLINDIGTVTLESEEAIRAARTAYNALNIQQKRQIKNLSVLADAEEKLAILKTQVGESNTQKAVNAFREKHADILSKTVATLVLEDKDNIQAALTDYGKQNVDTQILLNSDKNLLNRLNTRIAELEKIKENELEDEALKKEAVALAEEYKKQWKDFLALDVSQVTDSDLTGITQAIGSADSMAMLNSFFMDYIEAEYEHLLALKDAASKYVGNTSDAELAAAKFQSNFGYLLNMKNADVTRAEETDVRAAIIFYELLSEEAKELIGSDVTSKLLELLSAIEALPSDGAGNVTVTPNTEIVYKDRVVEKVTKEEEQTSLVNVYTKGLSRVVWWLLLSLLVTMLLSVFAAVMLILLRKKYNKFTKEGEIIC